MRPSDTQVHRTQDFMQVIYHIGAHVTDEDRLLKCLLKNTERLRAVGTVVPGPSRYRRLIGETLAALGGAQPGPEAQETLLDSIADEDRISRLVLSFENFICVPSRVFQQGQFYPLASKRAVALAGLLPAERVEFHLATRNPATFVPNLFGRVRSNDLTRFLSGADPANLMWSDVVRRLQEACPSARIVVWCNEDSPLIWGDILHALAGTDPEGEPLKGSYDLLSELMTAEGFSRFQTYLDSHPITSCSHRHRVIEAFLDKFALPDLIEEDVDLPGWSAADVDRVSDL
ncbi:MAG TPA: hypothetical protein EYP07_16115, partial [Kiloniellaceae bacterium]|nr:hypothetical protein [Kiloniellaceae bacterium]